MYYDRQYIRAKKTLKIVWLILIKKQIKNINKIQSHKKYLYSSEYVLPKQSYCHQLMMASCISEIRIR